MTTNDEWNHPLFQLGMEVGADLGRYESESEAQRAYDMGEIELWLEHCRPKTMEEWVEYEERVGTNFGDRWKLETTKDES